MTVGDVVVDSAPAVDRSDPAGPRLVDRMDPRLVRVLTVVGFGLPVAGYLLLLHRYSVNLIFADQWDDVVVVHQSYVHLFDWSSLWAPHNENRIFFPNLIVVALAHTVHFNVQVEEYLSAAMLLTATFLLIWAHKRRSPASPWLYYCPVAILTLSIVQWENTLWGFQMAWYLVYLCLATVIVLIDRSTLSWWTLAAVTAAAVVGSFSSLQGLIIWPIGLFLLYHRRRPWPMSVAWVAAAAISIVVYFRNFSDAVGPGPSLAWKHPYASLQFFLFAIGEVVDLPVTIGQSANPPVLLFGLAIVIMAAATVAIYGIRRDERSGGPVGVGLICFGLLFAAVVTQGRIFFGAMGAGQSRYTTFDVLVLVGIYLALLERPRWSVRARSPSPPVAAGLLPSDPRPRLAPPMAWLQRHTLRVLRAALLVAIVIQVSVGIYYGLPGAKANYDRQVADVAILRTIDHRSDATVRDRLYYARSAGWIRMQVEFLKEHHLSLFEGDAGNG
jgi:hypothetical protein